MAKNVVFCADGTWNGPGMDDDDDGVPDVTNVLKLFSNLQGVQTPATVRLKDEQERAVVDINANDLQIAKYLHGVGDSDNPLKKLLGGAFGAGVLTRIVRGYTFISRYYSPGDRIYIFGFSRGAYTARALAGMITSVGVMDANKIDLSDKIDAYRYGLDAWIKYRQNAGVKADLMNLATRLGAKRIPNGALDENATIHFLGVWDTVGALGIPMYGENDHRMDLFRFTNSQLSAKVKQGFHAVSIDELRADFTPTLWDAAPNVTEVWFAGAHSDVGGGLAQRGLSDIALDWMRKRAENAGLMLEPAGTLGLKRNPLQDIDTPWERGVFKVAPRAQRKMPEEAAIHESVQIRVAELGNNYRPAALATLIANGKLADEVAVIV